MFRVDFKLKDGEYAAVNQMNDLKVRPDPAYAPPASVSVSWLRRHYHRYLVVSFFLLNVGRTDSGSISKRFVGAELAPGPHALMQFPLICIDFLQQMILSARQRTPAHASAGGFSVLMSRSSTP